MKAPCTSCPFGDNPTARADYPVTIRGVLVATLVRATATVALLSAFGVGIFAARIIG